MSPSVKWMSHSVKQGPIPGLRRLAGMSLRAGNIHAGRAHPFADGSQTATSPPAASLAHPVKPRPFQRNTPACAQSRDATDEAKRTSCRNRGLRRTGAARLGRGPDGPNPAVAHRSRDRTRAGADPEDRSRGSRPCSRQHDDQRVCPVCRPHGLPVGLPDGERAQPPCGICRSTRARTAGRRRAGRARRLQPDADRLRQARPDLHRLSQPGRRLRGRVHRARQGADGDPGAGLRRPLLRLRHV